MVGGGRPALVLFRRAVRLGAEVAGEPEVGLSGMGERHLSRRYGRSDRQSQEARPSFFR